MPLSQLSVELPPFSRFEGSSTTPTPHTPHQVGEKSHPTVGERGKWEKGMTTPTQCGRAEFFPFPAGDSLHPASSHRSHVGRTSCIYPTVWRPFSPARGNRGRRRLWYFPQNGKKWAALHYLSVLARNLKRMTSLHMYRLQDYPA